jgi:hypothetical protein
MAYAGATAILATAAKHDEHGTCIYSCEDGNFRI